MVKIDQDNGFIQVSARVSNQYTNSIYSSILSRYLLPLSPQSYEDIHRQLVEFGSQLVEDGRVYKLSLESELHQPKLESYDSYGKRVDNLQLSSSWSELKKFAIESGLIKDGYTDQKFNKLLQLSKIYLFTSVSMVGCPLAMTDGAATLLFNLSDSNLLKQKYFEPVVDDRYERCSIVGQWMTERPGGSNLTNTETVAHFNSEKGSWVINGFKFFSSATDCQLAFLTAKTDPTSPKLSLFVARVKDELGNLNPGIKLFRLKDKFGTKSLPTAELVLSNLEVELVGEVDKGVKAVAPILQVTRLHASLAAISCLDRALQLVLDFSHKRVVLTLIKLMSELNLGIELSLYCVALVDYQVNFKSYTTSTSFVALGIDTKSELDLLLRLLIPLTKLITTTVCSTLFPITLASMGGMGYLEGSNIPRLMRDSLVNLVWEGSPNVMAIDFSKVLINDSSKAFKLVQKIMTSKLNNVTNRFKGSQFENQIQSWSNQIATGFQIVEAILATQTSFQRLEGLALDLANAVASLTARTLSLEQLVFTFHHRSQWNDKFTYQFMAMEVEDWSLVKLLGNIYHEEMVEAKGNRIEKVHKLDWETKVQLAIKILHFKYDTTKCNEWRCTGEKRKLTNKL